MMNISFIIIVSIIIDTRSSVTDHGTSDLETYIDADSSNRIPPAASNLLLKSDLDLCLNPSLTKETFNVSISS